MTMEQDTDLELALPLTGSSPSPGWSSDHQDAWLKHTTNGSVATNTDWSVIASIGRKLHEQFAGIFQIEFRVPKHGKGAMLELAVVPAAKVSYETAISSLKEAKAFFKGCKSMLETLRG